METLGIHLLTTGTAVWDTQTQPKSQTNSNMHCFVITKLTIIIIIIFFYFLYPWVYSSKGLKTKS